MIEIPIRWSHDETVRNLLREILINQEKQMAAIDDLNTNITKLQGDVTTLLSGVTPNAAVEAAAAAVAAIDTTVLAAIPPAPAPAAAHPAA